MIYRSLSVVTFFLFFSSCVSNAIECQLNWNDTPSIKVSTNLTDTCYAGIKINLGIKEKNQTFFINTQTALYIINKNKDLKLKAQIIKQSNENPALSLGSSQYFNEQFSTKQQLLFNNSMFELHTAARYNKRIPDQISVQIQTFIKNDTTPYFTISCFCPIYKIINIQQLNKYKTIGIKEDLFFKNNTIFFTMPKFYNPTKNNPIAPAINTGIHCLIVAGKEELEFQFQDEKQIAAYRQQIIKSFDEEITPALDAKLDELKKDLS